MGEITDFLHKKIMFKKHVAPTRERGYWLSDDKELERILEEKRKRLMRKLILEKKTSKNDDASFDEEVNRVVLSLLDDKGKEVLRLAESEFPQETGKAKLILYALFKKGFVEGPVDAGDFYRFLRYLGIPVRYESKILVASKGEKKPLSQILSERISELE
jgi:DNA-binding TFAR19-related protein (PDSD5 family)